MIISLNLYNNYFKSITFLLLIYLFFFPFILINGKKKNIFIIFKSLYLIIFIIDYSFIYTIIIYFIN